MSLVIDTPPAALLTAAEAKKHLRIFSSDDDSYDDAYIDSLISAATYHVDGEGGAIGRCIGEQTWVMTLDGFPDGKLHIPMPPTVSVNSIEYDNTANISTPLTGFRTLYLGASTGTSVLPAIGSEWPETNGEPGCVRVTFTGGYAATPPTIRHAILLLVSHWYEHREAALDTGAKFGLLDLPYGVQRLLAPHVFRHPTP